jgi:dUTP pyrophosphatase
MSSNEDKYKELKDLLFEDASNEEFNKYNEILVSLGIDPYKMEEDFQPKMDLEYTSETKKELSYAYPTDSGFDLYASEEVHLLPFGRALAPTGVRINIPDGYEIQVRSKSGLAINKGLMVLNSPGTVDQGYTGEIKVIIFNASDLAQTIEKDSKIAQAVISMCVSGKYVNLKMVNTIENKDRNENGFGSTGI